MSQTTVAAPIQLTGIGLHRGHTIGLALLPAPIDTGIVFERVDRQPALRTAARTEHVSATVLATTLGQGECAISTIEHVLAALSGMGIDNAIVQVNGDEVPVLDGSAAPFVAAIHSVGVRRQDAPGRIMRICQEVTVRRGDAWARLEPADDCFFSYTLDYDHPLFRRLPSYAELRLTPARFAAECAWARTFGFAAEVEMMHNQGLALGGSLDNAVVVGDDGVLNPQGLRAPDEFVRHKLLDAIGDLALLGMPLRGRFIGHKSGHALNHQLLRALLAEPASHRVERRD